ncbi:MAG: divalent-cation tolerance protein CutA [Haloplanus sp.]
MPTAYVTAPPDDARSIARTLVDERLAACVNVVPCFSVYRWGDDVHEDDEAILLAKTTAARYPDLEARVLEAHPSDVPCVERVEVADATDAFAAWCTDAVE